MQYLISLLVSIAIGLIIGLEREFRLVSQKDRFAGIRTFPLVAILGSVTGILAKNTVLWVLPVIAASIVIFSAVTYYVRSSAGHPGITTEIALIITFILGSMCALSLIREALAAAVLTTAFLSLKNIFHSFVSRITQEELFAFIKFTVLSMVLLPFLPNEGYGPGNVLNPRDICMVVVVISMLSFASYLVMKFAGASKGIMLSSIFGGLVSSTAVTLIFSSRTQSPDSPKSMYAAGIIAASSIMPLRIALVTFIFTTSLFSKIILPVAIMAITGAIASWYVLKDQNKENAKPELKLGNPLDLSNAFISTVIYVGVLVLVYYSKIWFGERGLVISGILSGLADVDAIAIALSDVVGKVPEMLPAYILLAAMISNTILKIILAFVRSHMSIRRKVVTGLGFIAASASIYLAVLLLMNIS
ncbi:MAG TPA: MgtC/SapB family protein [Cyclobacteriaceae bacterium]|nr:MgtC/SapB family protein [Cyclobacteriaceae bacterium]